MLNDFKKDYQIAEINYEMFKLNDLMECRQTALDIYSKSYEKTPRSEYGKRIEELQSIGD